MEGPAAPFLAVPEFAAHRALHLDADLGRPRPTSLDDARLVFCVRVDRRMDRGTRRIGSRAAAMRVSSLWAAGGDRRRRCRPSVNGLAMGHFRRERTRSDAGELRVAKS